MLEWGKGNRSVKKSSRRSEPLVRWCKSWQDNGKCLAKEKSCNWCCDQWVTGCEDVRFGKSSGLRILPRNTYCKSIRRCYGFLSDYLSFVSHRLHKEHRARIVSLACTSGMLTLGTADSCERSDAVLCVLCAISVWESNICVMVFWCVALFFYSSWVGWCHRLYCLRVSEWFAKNFRCIHIIRCLCWIYLPKFCHTFAIAVAKE